VLAASDTGTAIREWIVGGGRVIAAVVALHLGVWRERWRPRLELHLDKSSDQLLVTLTTPRSSSGHERPDRRISPRRTTFPSRIHLVSACSASAMWSSICRLKPLIRVAHSTAD
jgi:hypothetical protein